MTRIFARPGLTAILCLSMYAPALPAGQVELRYKFAEGQKLSYRMTQEQDMEVTSSMIPGSPQKLATRLEVDMYQKVLAGRKGGARVEVGFERVDARAQFAGNSIPVPGMDEITRVRLELDMTDRGETSKVELHDADKVGPQARQIAHDMKKSIAQFTLVLPDEPIEPGETWSVTQEIPARLGGAKDLMMKVESTNKFVGMEKQRGKRAARIDTKLKISLHGKTEQMGTPMKADMDGSGSQTSWFLVKQGHMLRVKAEFEIEGAVTGSSQGTSFSTRYKIGTKVDMNLK